MMSRFYVVTRDSKPQVSADPSLPVVGERVAGPTPPLEAGFHLPHRVLAEDQRRGQPPSFWRGLVSWFLTPRNEGLGGGYWGNGRMSLPHAVRTVRDPTTADEFIEKVGGIGGKTKNMGTGGKSKLKKPIQPPVPKVASVKSKVGAEKGKETNPVDTASSAKGKKDDDKPKLPIGPIPIGGGPERNGGLGSMAALLKYAEALGDRASVSFVVSAKPSGQTSYPAGELLVPVGETVLQKAVLPARVLARYAKGAFAKSQSKDRHLAGPMVVELSDPLLHDLYDPGYGTMGLCGVACVAAGAGKTLTSAEVKALVTSEIMDRCSQSDLKGLELSALGNEHDFSSYWERAGLMRPPDADTYLLQEWFARILGTESRLGAYANALRRNLLTLDEEGKVHSIWVADSDWDTIVLKYRANAPGEPGHWTLITPRGGLRDDSFQNLPKSLRRSLLLSEAVPALQELLLDSKATVRPTSLYNSMFRACGFEPTVTFGLEIVPKKLPSVGTYLPSCLWNDQQDRTDTTFECTLTFDQTNVEILTADDVSLRRRGLAGKVDSFGRYVRRKLTARPTGLGEIKFQLSKVLFGAFIHSYFKTIATKGDRTMAEEAGLVSILAVRGTNYDEVAARQNYMFRGLIRLFGPEQFQLKRRLIHRVDKFDPVDEYYALSGQAVLGDGPTAHHQQRAVDQHTTISSYRDQVFTVTDYGAGKAITPTPVLEEESSATPPPLVKGGGSEGSATDDDESSSEEGSVDDGEERKESEPPVDNRRKSDLPDTKPLVFTPVVSRGREPKGDLLRRCRERAKALQFPPRDFWADLEEKIMREGMDVTAQETVGELTAGLGPRPRLAGYGDPLAYVGPKYGDEASLALQISNKKEGKGSRIVAIKAGVEKEKFHNTPVAIYPLGVATSWDKELGPGVFPQAGSSIELVKGFGARGLAKEPPMLSFPDFSNFAEKFAHKMVGQVSTLLAELGPEPDAVEEYRRVAKGKRTQAQIDKNVDLYQRSLSGHLTAREEREYGHNSCFLKHESNAKLQDFGVVDGKPRLICTMSVRETVNCARLVRVMEVFEKGIMGDYMISGLNSAELAETIGQASLGRTTATDYSSWEATATRQVADVTENLLLREALKVAGWQETLREFEHSIKESERKVYAKNVTIMIDARHSGKYITYFANCLLNMMVYWWNIVVTMAESKKISVREATELFLVSRPLDVCKPVFSGDDGIVATGSMSASVCRDLGALFSVEYASFEQGMGPFCSTYAVDGLLYGCVAKVCLKLLAVKKGLGLRPGKVKFLLRMAAYSAHLKYGDHPVIGALVVAIGKATSGVNAFKGWSRYTDYWRGDAPDPDAVIRDFPREWTGCSLDRRAIVARGGIERPSVDYTSQIALEESFLRFDWSNFALLDNDPEIAVAVGCGAYLDGVEGHGIVRHSGRKLDFVRAVYSEFGRRMPEPPVNTPFIPEWDGKVNPVAFMLAMRA